MVSCVAKAADLTGDICLGTDLGIMLMTDYGD